MSDSAAKPSFDECGFRSAGTPCECGFEESAAHMGRPLPTAGGETEVASSMPATGYQAAATPSGLTRAQEAELEHELELHRLLVTAEGALHEIAENTTRGSYQHRARALLALEELEARHVE